MTIKYTKAIVWSNIVFLLSSLINLNPWIMLGGLVLTLGSGWMHRKYSYESKVADWYGMYFYPLTIAIVLLNLPFMWFWILLCSLILFLARHELADNIGAIGILMLVIVAIKISIDLWMGIISAIIFISYVGVDYWESKVDYAEKVHTFKHFVGAIGFSSLIITFKQIQGIFI